MVDLDELERLLERATDAPWEADEDDDSIASMADGLTAVVVGESGTPYGVDVADARLICALRNAAPELLKLIRTAETSLLACRAMAEDQLRMHRREGVTDTAVLGRLDGIIREVDEWRGAQ